jgi:HPt (histidine-containing phosphotransfer) domain-containing protein
MSAPATSIDLLADLRVNYVQRLHKRVETLSAFVQACRQGTVRDESISANHRCVHSMIGSAAIFGHPELSESALAAERAFLERTGDENETLISRIELLLKDANEVLNRSKTAAT